MFLICQQSKQSDISHLFVSLQIPVEGDIAGLVREAYFMQTLKHPNLVTLNDMFLEDGCITLVSEYCDKGDLQSLIDLKLPFTEDFVIHVLFQLAMGVAYIHHQHVAHRDIKPANVFITSKGIIKVYYKHFLMSFVFAGSHTGTNIGLCSSKL